MTVFETLDTEFRRKGRHDVTNQIFCCLQMPGGDTTNCQIPVPGTHRASNARGLPGGMLAAGMDSHMTVIVIF